MPAFYKFTTLATATTQPNKKEKQLNMHEELLAPV